jgi:aubergine-like protein
VLNFKQQMFLQRYNIRIRNLQQPLLVTRSKAKEIKAGLPDIVYLIPELCRMTGLTDAMRANFRLMSALAEHTRMGPNKRIEKLLAFSQRLNQEPAVSYL